MANYRLVNWVVIKNLILCYYQELDYFISITLSLVLLILPTNYKNAVYTPSILGYIWLLLFLIILICYIYLMLKTNRKRKNMIKDSFIFFIFIIFTLSVWIYQANLARNL